MATYEEQMLELETIVSDIESGEMGIDQLTAQVSRASKLLTALREQLTKVEADVNKVLQNANTPTQ